LELWVYGVSLLRRQRATKPDDLCQNKHSNVEMRECYANEQARVNSEADLLANKIAAVFRKQSQDSSNGAVITQLMLKAASAVLQSQKSWKEYRDQHCSAVEFSWTTGSGAGTAHESCMFNLGRQRVEDLRADFNAYLPHSDARNSN
jgi:uncharacterized protein YecT (DUF1311 family)